METRRRNKNRGYQRLTVWQDAIEFYVQTRRAARGWPFELKRVASQQIVSSDSVHRNIAEGYCRRSLKEYLHFLNIALGSLGESVSALQAYVQSGDLAPEQFESLDVLAYKLENGLLKLVAALERKQQDGDWIDSLVVQESNAVYQTSQPLLQPSTTPSL